MKTNQLKNSKKEPLIKVRFMADKTLIYIIIIGILVLYFVPTYNVITISVSYPQNGWDAQLVNDKMPYLQWLLINQTITVPQAQSYGTIPVNITIVNSTGSSIHTNIFNVTRGSFTLHTYQSVISRTFIIVNIQDNPPFSKVISVG